MSISSKDIQTSIREIMVELYGEVGAGNCGNNSVVKFFDSENSLIFVIRTPREGETQIRFALSCVKSVKDKKDLIIRTLSVNSCPRTCMAELRRIFQIYYSDVNDSKNESEVLFKLLDSTEL